MKKIIQTLLLIFVMGGLAVAVFNRSPQDDEEKGSTVEAKLDTSVIESSSPSQTTQNPENRSPVVVTYFTSDVRCASCRKIEALTRRTVEERFALDLARGGIRFETLNIDKPENKHFIQDYELAFKTVVISYSMNDETFEWKKMDDVWKLLNAPDKFMDYLSVPIAEALKANS
jgi:hypothetical protein